MNVSNFTFFTPITCLCFQNFIKSQISIIYKSAVSLRTILLSFLRKLISVVIHGSFLEVPLVVAVAPLLLFTSIGIVRLGTRLWGAGTGLWGAGTGLGGARAGLGRPLLVQLVVDLVGRVDWLRRGWPCGDLVVLWCWGYRLGSSLLGRGARPLPGGLLRWVGGRDFIWVGTVSVVCQVSIICLLIGRNIIILYIRNFLCGFNLRWVCDLTETGKNRHSENKPFYTSSLRVLEIAKIGLFENLTHLPSVIFSQISWHEKLPIYGSRDKIKTFICLDFITDVLIYTVKVQIFTWGNFCFFPHIIFIAKISSMRKLHRATGKKECIEKIATPHNILIT